jgi:hypothetical protein
MYVKNFYATSKNIKKKNFFLNLINKILFLKLIYFIFIVKSTFN